MYKDLESERWHNTKLRKASGYDKSQSLENSQTAKQEEASKGHNS